MGKYQLRRQKVGRLPETITEKWSEAVLEEGFVPLPKKLLRCIHRLFEGQSVEELAALFAVVDYRRPGLSRPPSAKYLAFLAGLPVEKFMEALKRLHEKEYVNWENTEDGLDVEITGILRKIITCTDAMDQEEKILEGQNPPLLGSG